MSDTDPEFFGTTACATLVAADGVLYGPANIPAGSAAAPRTAWTPVSQEAAGRGIAADPYRLTTVVQGGPLVVTQVDTYVTGAESYGTRVTVLNTRSNAIGATIYRAGDCYLQNNDNGFGRVYADAGAVACTTTSDADSRIEQWAPLTPGSRYLEARYSEVWSRIGQQLPFNDTCRCEENIDNGAGLSWSTIIEGGGTEQVAHLTSFSPDGSTVVQDSDGDGFPDTWEEPDGGVDTDGDGTIDVRLADLGASPDRPDIFVQVGWIDTESCFLFFCNTRNRRPSLAALGDVQRSFATHGVRLHIDAGPGSVMNPDTGATWGNRSRARAVTGPARLAGSSSNSNNFDWSAFDAYKAQRLPAERANLFHYALYVGDFNAAGNSGLARPTSATAGLAGSDFIVATDVGIFDDDGQRGMSRVEEAGTFMHELGHNLGLTHGGSPSDAAVPTKPNYPSVMNYYWQLSGTFKNSTLGLLDYSEGTLNSLDENALNEADGLGPDSAAGDIAARWSCPDGAIQGPLPSVRDVDWNCDGSISANDFSQSVNTYRGSNADLAILRDHDDWDNLVFDGGGTLGGAGVPGQQAMNTEVDEPTANELVALAPASPAVTVSAPGQLTMQVGTSSPLEIELSNPRGSTRSYELSVVADGVSIAGLPPALEVAAGSTARVPLDVSVDDATSEAFFEISVESVDGDPSDRASSTTQVFVVDRPVDDQPGETGPVVTPPDDTAVTRDLVTTSAPAFDGPVRVGTTVRVTPPTYDVAEATVTYEWYVDDTYIDGVTGPEYQPVPGDRDRLLSVRTTGNYPGFRPKVDEVQPVAVAAGPSSTALSGPAFTGDVRAGGTVTAYDGAWSRAGVVLSRQWLLDGQAVPGATNRTLNLTAADVGRELALQVIATEEGYASGSARSGSAVVAPGAAPAVSELPRINGSVKVGRTIRTSLGQWSTSDLDLSVQWLRDGASIAGAVSTAYRVRPADIGHRLSARVIATRDGFQPAVATTAVERVPRAISTLVADLDKRAVLVTRRATVLAQVSVAGLASAGELRVLEGSDVLTSSRLRAEDRGETSLELPQLDAGVHRLRVVFVGGPTRTRDEQVVRLRVVAPRR